VSVNADISKKVYSFHWFVYLLCIICYYSDVSMDVSFILIYQTPLDIYHSLSLLL